MKTEQEIRLEELDVLEIQLKNILARSREERSIDAMLNRVNTLLAETNARAVLMRRNIALGNQDE